MCCNEAVRFEVRHGMEGKDAGRNRQRGEMPQNAGLQGPASALRSQRAQGLLCLYDNAYFSIEFRKSEEK